ncbi:hypothetical protein CSB63_1096 [Streptococcus thermophilus]|nr:hypothetical protein CSB63_1096 [Streptococcus thermophilus]
MQLYYNGFIPFCVYTTYFTLPKIIETQSKTIEMMANELTLLREEEYLILIFRSNLYEFAYES